MSELLTPSDYRKMRWKNGAGYTLELARSAGDDLAEFDWRISMADVTTSGAFSPFHGMQRILTVLEGEGLALQVDGKSHILQTLQSLPFSGDSAVSCELLAGPIRDFNLIYQPERYAARYQWIVSHQASDFFSSADIVFIFNSSLEVLDIRVEGELFQLEQQHSLYLHSHQNVKHILFPSSTLRQCCLIELIKI
ncbi:histidine uptake and utilization operon protein HutD [Acinetobacter tandoii]|uniref:HutD/Ves family protein n=1 Tax=Acinetobacter tandoii TaxID=202954 RepID=UPI000C2041B8|nr:HutD family protein [Acinetobacter tandoii]PJG44002.1 histidine uptake and utilization operon protein HutD [Acinetobacter tandoii]